MFRKLIIFAILVVVWIMLNEYTAWFEFCYPGAYGTYVLIALCVGLSVCLAAYLLSLASEATLSSQKTTKFL